MKNVKVRAILSRDERNKIALELGDTIYVPTLFCAEAMTNDDMSLHPYKITSFKLKAGENIGEEEYLVADRVGSTSGIDSIVTLPLRGIGSKFFVTIPDANFLKKESVENATE